MAGHRAAILFNLNFIEKADASDGKADLRLIYPRLSISCFPLLAAMFKKNYHYLDKYSQTERSRVIKIRREDGSDLSVNQDGELITGIKELTAEVVPQGIQFVVPKGVRL